MLAESGALLGLAPFSGRLATMKPMIKCNYSHKSISIAQYPPSSLARVFSGSRSVRCWKLAVRHRFHIAGWRPTSPENASPSARKRPPFLGAPDRNIWEIVPHDTPACATRPRFKPPAAMVKPAPRSSPSPLFHIVRSIHPVPAATSRVARAAARSMPEAALRLEKSHTGRDLVSSRLPAPDHIRGLFRDHHRRGIERGAPLAGHARQRRLADPTWRVSHSSGRFRAFRPSEARRASGHRRR